MSELLQCPLCGPGKVYLNPPSETYRYGSINCPACLLTLPGEIRDQRELIEVWNTRPSGWQPIETAPKDGSKILLFTIHEADEYLDETFQTVQIGFWDFGSDNPDPMWARAACWDLAIIGDPTHWMPLPAPPEVQP